AIFGRDICRQLDLDLEYLLIAVFRIDDVVLREPDVFRRDIACTAVQLHEVSCAQRRGGQKIIEGTRCRTVAFIANRLVGDYREIIELGFETQLVEKVDFNFHQDFPQRGAQKGVAAIIRCHTGMCCLFPSPSQEMKGTHKTLLFAYESKCSKATW